MRTVWLPRTFICLGGGISGVIFRRALADYNFGLVRVSKRWSRARRKEPLAEQVVDEERSLIVVYGSDLLSPSLTSLEVSPRRNYGDKISRAPEHSLRCSDCERSIKTNCLSYPLIITLIIFSLAPSPSLLGYYDSENTHVRVAKQR